MSEALQILGAVLVLVPFASLQLGSLRSESPIYLAMNLVGSGLLAVLALVGAQWGFLLLESCWALVAGWGLFRGHGAATERVLRGD